MTINQDQQTKIKELISKGKEQGYLTYAEVNDHLPEGIVDSDQIEDIINLSVKNIYQSKEVIEKEISGYNIINKLLDTFIISLNNYEEGSESSYDKLILHLLPNHINLKGYNLYDRLIGVCHFISSMSDSQAVTMYKKITGHQF